MQDKLKDQVILRTSEGEIALLHGKYWARSEVLLQDIDAEEQGPVTSMQWIEVSKEVAHEFAIHLSVGVEEEGATLFHRDDEEFTILVDGWL